MEINLLTKYPKTKRDPSQRAEVKTEEHHRIARLFEEGFFDGHRSTGYGGYRYMSEYFKGVVSDFISHYKLTKNSKVLDVGCAKGFMLYDFTLQVPDIYVCGIDVSRWATSQGHPKVKDKLSIANAKDLSMFNDNEFDLVVSINTIHNLGTSDCILALKELERVGKNCFLTVDAWNTDEEEQRMRDWNLTAQTMMSVTDWKSLFKEVGYTGDYYWFIP